MLPVVLVFVLLFVSCCCGVMFFVVMVFCGVRFVCRCLFVPVCCLLLGEYAVVCYLI